MEGKIALQLYTLRDFVNTEEEFLSTLKKVKKIGYNAVQISAVSFSAEIIIKLLKEADIEGCANHISFNEIKNYEELLKNLKTLQVKHTAVAALPPEYRNEDGYKKAAEELSKLGEKLVKEGIILSYHNHAFEFEKYGDKLGIELLLDNSDPNYLKMEVDTYWVHYGGYDVIKFCEKYKDRIRIVHLKDIGIKDNSHIMMEVGEGNLNWEGILKVMKEAEVEWYIVEQDKCQRDPFESIKISLENLKKMGLEA